jgi:alkylation response protein AidB-like acyl-CoA dehydrogenase
MSQHKVYADAVERARMLKPVILAHRDEMEQRRQMPQRLVAAMADAGLFRLSMPRALGGPELDPLTQLRVVEALSMIDASVGWTAYVGLHSGYFAAFLEPDVARDMYADLDAFTGGATKADGTAVVVPGGYQVSGHWAFGSCCQHSRWIISGCTVVEDGSPRRRGDGSVETRLCYLPGDAVEVVDTWTTTGLRGTGSHDYTAKDVFVPSERTFNIESSPILSREPLYSMRNMYMVNHPGLPLGLARFAIDTVLALCAGKQTRIGSNLREEPLTQLAIARAETLLGSARSFVFEVFDELWAILQSGQTLPPRQKALFRLAICNAYEAGAEVVTLMYRTASGTALYASNPLDRCFRDMHTAAQHFIVSSKFAEAAGRVMLGLKPGVPNF